MNFAYSPYDQNSYSQFGFPINNQVSGQPTYNPAMRYGFPQSGFMNQIYQGMPSWGNVNNQYSPYQSTHPFPQGQDYINHNPNSMSSLYSAFPWMNPNNANSMEFSQMFNSVPHNAINTQVNPVQNPVHRVGRGQDISKIGQTTFTPEQIQAGLDRDGVNGWFGSLKSWMRDQNWFGDSTHQGILPTVGGLTKAGIDSYLGWQQMKQAKDQFEFGKQAYLTNLRNQAKLTNDDLIYRQQQRHYNEPDMFEAPDDTWKKKHLVNGG